MLLSARCLCETWNEAMTLQTLNESTRVRRTAGSWVRATKKKTTQGFPVSLNRTYLLHFILFPRNTYSWRIELRLFWPHDVWATASKCKFQSQHLICSSSALRSLDGILAPKSVHLYLRSRNGGWFKGSRRVGTKTGTFITSSCGMVLSPSGKIKSLRS